MCHTQGLKHSPSQKRVNEAIIVTLQQDHGASTILPNCSLVPTSQRPPFLRRVALRDLVQSSICLPKLKSWWLPIVERHVGSAPLGQRQIRGLVRRCTAKRPVRRVRRKSAFIRHPRSMGLVIGGTLPLPDAQYDPQQAQEYAQGNISRQIPKAITMFTGWRIHAKPAIIE